MTHDATHEALLEKVLCGALDRESPEVRMQIEECEACREKLSGLDRAAAFVDTAGSESLAARMEEELAEASELSTALRETAADAMRRTIATEPFVDGGSAAAPRRRSRWLGVAAVAAAVLVAFLAQRSLTVRPEPPVSDDGSKPLMLDTGGLELLAPIGEVEAYAEFQWSFDGSPDGFYELRIWEASRPTGSQPDFEKLEIDGNTWTPTEDDLRSIPSSMRWEVRAFDGAATLVGRAGGTARLR